ncbi:MAG: hypothetical protein M3371_11030 [Acidobacteriota bacterium]|nr:hypothetical protein [Acidobacteriota bacterium]
MNEAANKVERERLLEELQRARQAALESQAEAAVYRDMLEDCYEAVRQALAHKDIELLPKIINWTMFFTTPSEQEGKRLGKDFLDAYVRDAGWLRDAKKALEQIKAAAEKLLEDNKTNAELKKRIIAIAEDGLITHI